MSTLEDPSPQPPKIDGGRIGRNLAWMTGGDFAGRLIAFGVTVFLARAVGVSGVGALGSALALVAYFRIFVNAGLDPYSTRDTAQDVARLPSIYARIVAARLVLAAASAVLILGSLLVLPDRLTAHFDLIVIYGLMVFADAVATEWAIRGIERMKLIAVGIVGQHLIMAAAIFLFLPGHLTSLWIVPAAQVTSLFAMQAWFYLRLRGSFGPLRPHFDWQEIIRVIRDAQSVMYSKFLRIFYIEGGVLLLALIAGASSAGEYFASQRLILMGVMAGVIVQTTTYPTMSRLSEHSAGAAAEFQGNLLRYVLVMMVPGIVIGAWYAEPIVLLIFGDEFTATPPILLVMLFTIPLYTINLGAQNLLLTRSLGSKVLVGNAVAAGTHVLLALVLIPGYLGVGAAWACLAGEALSLAYVTYILRREMGVSLLQYRLLAPLAAGGAMVSVLMMTGSAAMYTQVGAAILTYCLAALVFRALRAVEIAYVRDSAHRLWRATQA